MKMMITKRVKMDGICFLTVANYTHNLLVSSTITLGVLGEQEEIFD